MIKEIEEKMYEKIFNVTLEEVLKNNTIYTYGEKMNSDFTVSFKKINKERIIEEFTSIITNNEQDGFLKYILINNKDRYIDIIEVMVEKLEKRIYYTYKYINNGFDNITISDVIKLRRRIEEEVMKRVLRESKESICNRLLHVNLE